MNKLSRLDLFNGIFAYVLFVLAFWYNIWTWTQGGNPEPWYEGLINQWYFTNQSNMLVTLTVVLYWIRLDHKPFFKYLASITLVNIFITATGFHFILAPETIDFYGHLSHTIVPILYVVFYFTAIRAHLKLKQFWINLIYPMSYLLFVLILGDFPLRLVGGGYPYGFVDPNAYDNGLAGLLQFTLLIMFPAYTVISILMVYLKSLFERLISQKTS